MGLEQPQSLGGLTMNHTNPVNEIKKLHVEATVMFAISHIPDVDEKTLETFLELVNVNGNFGTISQAQLTEKMKLLLKHVPNACEKSLFTLSELLSIHFPRKEKELENGKVMGIVPPVYEPELMHSVWQH
jgi:hypothetical protein